MLKRYRKLLSQEFIVIGVDTSAGGGDYCAAQFLSKTNLDVPWVYHSPNTATEMTNKLVSILEEIYDTTKVKPIIAYERNNGGVYEIERLAALNLNGKFRIYQMHQVGNVENPDEKKLGWDTNSATRPAMLQQLKEAIDNHLIRLYDKATVNELFSFITNKTSTAWKAQAEANSHDDLIMALAIAWQLYQTEDAQQGFSDRQQQELRRLQQLSSQGELYS